MLEGTGLFTVHQLNDLQLKNPQSPFYSQILEFYKYMRHICNVPVHVTMMILSRWDDFVSNWCCIELFIKCINSQIVEADPEKFYRHNLDYICIMSILLHTPGDT